MPTNVAQKAVWNGSAGNFWVQYQDQIERCSADATNALIAYAAPKPGENVLDIGCGSGRVSRHVAQIVGPEGAVVGVDISAPMLASARADSAAKNLKFVEADASSHPFPPTFDLVMSRFGVMFFDDPVSAFRNLAGALNRKGRVAFVCFRGPAENAFATVPYTAAKPLLPERSPPDPNAPGSFAFANPDRVRMILKDAGFNNVEMQRLDGSMHLGPLDDAALLATFVIGPVSRALEGADEDVRRRTYEAVKSAIGPFATDNGIELGLACWLVRAS